MSVNFTVFGELTVFCYQTVGGVYNLSASDNLICSFFAEFRGLSQLARKLHVLNRIGSRVMAAGVRIAMGECCTSESPVAQHEDSLRC